MNKTRTPQSISSIEATLKRFDEEEAALHEQLCAHLGNIYKLQRKLQLKRGQAMGRLKKAQESLR